MLLSGMRSWRLDVDTIRIEGDASEGLEISADVERSIKHEPNTASVRVWNLPRDARRKLQQLSVKGKQPGKIRTELHAGYDGVNILLFKGDLRFANSEQDGADWVTTIEGDDGGRARLDARVSQSFPPGTRVDQVIKACTDALGLGTGNLLPLLSGLPAYDAGTSLEGRASDCLRGLLRGLGLSYSVQHGTLQALQNGAALGGLVTKLTPTSGLVGTPTRTPEGRVQCTSLLRPGLDPGLRVRLESEDLQGTYKVRSVRYEIDASANPWYAHLELSE